MLSFNLSLFLMKNSLVNLFLIGASKCGSTFMHDMLGQHPNIQMSLIKEPFVFFGESYRDKISIYSDIFSDSERAIFKGESSPIYSETTVCPEIPLRIHEYNSQAKIIYLVRSPYDRLKSVWRQTVSTGHWVEKKHYNILMPTDFEKAVFEYPPFLEATKYYTHLSSYVKVFGDDQVKVILFEDMVADLHGTMNTIFSFLEVDAGVNLSVDNAEKNEGKNKKPYNPLIARVSKSVPSSIKAFASDDIKAGLRNVLDKFSGRKFSEPEFTPEMRTQIYKVLEPEVEGVYKYLGITNDPWGFFTR